MEEAVGWCGLRGLRLSAHEADSTGPGPRDTSAGVAVGIGGGIASADAKQPELELVAARAVARLANIGLDTGCVSSP